MEEAIEKIIIDRNELDSFIKTQSKIRDMAEKIKDLYCELHNNLAGKFLNFVNLDENYMFFEGEEYFRGDCDRHWLEIPISYLTDKDWFENESNYVAQKKLEQEKEREQHRLKESERLKNEELILLKKLKEKYERDA